MKSRDKNITWGLLEAYKATLKEEQKKIFSIQEEERRDKLIVYNANNIAEIERIQSILRDEAMNTPFHCKDGKVFFDD